MNIHVDHQDRPSASQGQPTMPDTFLANTQLQAVDFLERHIRELAPLVAVTGGAGMGKTVALNVALARRESSGDRVIRVNNFVAGPLSLHRLLAASLGIADAGELSAEELEPVLRKALAEIDQADPPVVAVDDAQSLLPETLRYLCLLAGLRDTGRPLFRILLVGRPGFTVRQPIPLQFTLEVLHPDGARALVEHGLAVAGVDAPVETVQQIVQQGQGNLRMLDSLLRTTIEQGRTRGRRRRPSIGARVSMAPQRGSRPVRSRSLGAWLVVPALLVVGAAGAAIIYRDGTVEPQTGKAVSTPAAPATQTVPPSSAGTTPSPRTSPPAAVQAAPPPPLVVQAVPPSPTSVQAAPPPSRLPGPPAPVPDPVKVPPMQASDTATAPPSSRDGSSPSEASTPAPGPSASLKPSTPLSAAPSAPSSAPVVAAAPTPSPANVAPAPALQALASPPAQQATRFRVYNISACHHGVCPRWSVTDLDRRARFVAALDASALRLDRDTTQRLREGALDLIVSGSVTRGGPDGRILVAETLQTVSPHHVLPHPPSSEPAEPASPPVTQSPPPGFLSLPASSPPAEPPTLGP